MKRSVSLLVMLFALTLLLMLLTVSVLFSQSVIPDQESNDYAQVIAKRSEKIVAALHIGDTVLIKKLQNVVVDQYYHLSLIHDVRNTKIKNLKAKKGISKQAVEDASKKAENEADAELAQQHTVYLSKLAKLCTPEQIDQVKDGMTYGVLPVTYKAYQEMLPDLTEDQKKQILAWLTEAREHAMDAESSEKKHAWFGKYKGRINNYLSAAGIDMKKAEADWQQRIKEKLGNQ